MTRRRRSNKARLGPLTLDELTMWTCWDREQLIEEFGTLEEARAQWSRRRGLVNTAANPVPEAFWGLDGPAALVRRRRGPESTFEEAIAADEAFDRRRAKWLADYGGDWTVITPTSNGSAAV